MDRGPRAQGGGGGVITLLTDFGTADGYVAAMKGVILSSAPDVPIVDVTHDIPPQDVQAGAFTLLAFAELFPIGTIHLAVVDPGVGSTRRGIAARCGGRLLVGPDNGLFSYLLERDGDALVFELAERRFFREPVSATFHGRDVFAPVAASLARGLPLDELGPRVRDPVRLPPIRTERREDGTRVGAVVHVDRFGNLVTSISRADLPEAAEAGATLSVDGQPVAGIRRFYAEPGIGARPFGIWGSAGFLEISVNGGSAAERLGVARGATVHLRPARGAEPAATRTHQ
jgi:S-adenosyl-L-methionine hydrolase (adenosine-forming)